MTKEIVISYYNSLDFQNILPLLDKDIKITVYNKSGVSLGGDFEEIMIENIGREGHTYLTHILNNYDKLSDVTVFIQDDIYNHLFDNNYILNNLSTNISEEFYQFPCSWRSGPGARPFKRTVHKGFLDLNLGNDYDIKKFCEKFNIELPIEYSTEVCAIFLVSRNKILKHSKEFYSELINWLLLEKNNGYTLEHTWKILFM